MLDDVEIKRVTKIIDRLIESEIGDSERLSSMRTEFAEKGEFSNDNKIYFREKLEQYKQLESREPITKQENRSPLSLALLSLIPIVDLWVFWKLGKRYGLTSFIVCVIIWGGAGYIIESFSPDIFYLDFNETTGYSIKSNELNFGYILIAIAVAGVIQVIIVAKEAEYKQEEDLLEQHKDLEKQEEFQAMKNLLTDYANVKKTINQDPLEILKLRYANGQITKEEFDRMKEDLKD